MKIKSILFAALVAIAFSSCDKIAGPGGTSSITGTVSGINESYGQYETIDHIFFSIRKAKKMDEERR